MAVYELHIHVVGISVRSYVLSFIQLWEKGAFLLLTNYRTHVCCAPFECNSNFCCFFSSKREGGSLSVILPLVFRTISIPVIFINVFIHLPPQPITSPRPQNKVLKY